MQQNRGVLYITDPMDRGKILHTGIKTNETTLIFNENERYLSQAQQALWEMRKECGWICISARGRGALIALALAAQLPVDRLALADFSLSGPQKLPRELLRLRTYVRRNLWLVVSEIILSDSSIAELRALERGSGSRRICLLEKWQAADLTAPWEQLCEKTCLFRGNVYNDTVDF